MAIRPRGGDPERKPKFQNARSMLAWHPRKHAPVTSLVHNGRVPFTPAHAAAALPFRRMRLVTSALVVGTFAPDFEYFLQLMPRGGFGHTLRGVFVLDLPLALLVLWIFQTYLKVPLTRLLPDGFQRRVAPHLGEFRFLGWPRFAVIVASILLGVATHLVWDSFTHPGMWLYHHWLFLRRTVRLPLVGTVEYCKVFQHASTVFGIGVLLVWFVRWYQTTEPCSEARNGSLKTAQKARVIFCIAAIALLGGLLHPIVSIGLPTGVASMERFTGQAVATAIALMWWQLVAYGVFTTRHMRREFEPSPRTW